MAKGGTAKLWDRIHRLDPFTASRADKIVTTMISNLSIEDEEKEMMFDKLKEKFVEAWCKIEDLKRAVQGLDPLYSEPVEGPDMSKVEEAAAKAAAELEEE